MSMKLGIMQPYFFPYLGYFDCIYKSDYWIVFDIVQYTQKTWMNRNRVLKPDSGWQYITVPLNKFQRFSSIQEIIVKDLEGTKERIKRQLQHYKKRAPYFKNVLKVVDDAFVRSESNRLVDLNVAALSATCNYLCIPFKFDICSRMELELPKIEHSGQWALEICTEIGASTYINSPGGKDIFKPKEFRDRGIQLCFSKMVSFAYSCPGYKFIEHLSILDVMMWNSADTITKYLEQIIDDMDFV